MFRRASRAGGRLRGSLIGHHTPRPKVGGWHPVEWLCELGGTFFQLSIGFTVVAILSSPLSPINAALPSAAVRLILVAATFGLLAAVVAVSPLGKRSGAHLNPAMTLAFWARGQTHWHDLIGYTIAQTAGALLASGVFFLAAGPWARTVNFARTVPHEGLPGWVAAGIEAALTFCLVLVVLLMVSSRRTARYTPLAVTGLLMVMIPTGAPPTGASMNPARTLGPDLATLDFSHLWVYVLGPCAGALIAAAVFPLVSSGRRILTAKIFHDERYPSTQATRLPAKPAEAE